MSALSLIRRAVLSALSLIRRAILPALILSRTRPILSALILSLIRRAFLNALILNLTLLILPARLIVTSCLLVGILRHIMLCLLFLFFCLRRQYFGFFCFRFNRLRLFRGSFDFFRRCRCYIHRCIFRFLSFSGGFFLCLSFLLLFQQTMLFSLCACNAHQLSFNAFQSGQMVLHICLQRVHPPHRLLRSVDQLFVHIDNFQFTH